MSKAAKKPSALKLSRSKKSENVDFNQSADDFVDDSNKKFQKKKTNSDKSVSDKSESSTTFGLQSSDGLPKCPFCGKSFLVGQELKRWKL